MMEEYALSGCGVLCCLWSLQHGGGVRPPLDWEPRLCIAKLYISCADDAEWAVQSLHVFGCNAGRGMGKIR